MTSASVTFPTHSLNDQVTLSLSKDMIPIVVFKPV